MNELIYPRERTLGGITLILGVLVWITLIVGSLGAALIGLLVGFIFYLFAQSALIAHIKGNGIELTEKQFPDIYEQFAFCCDRLKIYDRPKAYILNGNGGFNAFATKFLGTHFVVLMSDVVDAMSTHPDGVKFYIGHELGHIKRKHIRGSLLRWPVLWLPLIGAAYSRARESTCDRHGLACCESSTGAGRALAALSTGSERWKNLDIKEYLRQNKYTSSFWMSLHELISGYPWITKRVARVVDPTAEEPKRNGFSYLFALFMPYAGRMGSGFGLLIVIYIVGIIAAIAIPQFQTYRIKSHTTSAIYESESIRESLANYYMETQNIPTLEQVGAPDSLSDGSTISLSPESMIMTIKLKEGELFLIPSLDDQGRILWQCKEGEGIKPNQLPDFCK
ncbi:MAG: M48 family metallopeptidase [Desulfobacterales bacterium]|nr:M48 family metallopeptidase [Desulfobacterales bacterium]